MTLTWKIQMGIIVAAIGLLFGGGCQSKDASKVRLPLASQDSSGSRAAPGDGKSKNVAAESAATNSPIPPAKKAKPALRLLDAPPRPAYEPTVAFSDAHRRTCLVGVGDQLPPLTATNLAGEKEELSTLFGEKLTVLVFWNHRRVFALEQFQRLQEEVASYYDGTGVQVIAVNVGDEPATVAATYQEIGGTFACLVDPDGAAFAQLATEKLPRTYVVDPAGKILWFDIEFSRGTRVELDNAVRFFLQPPGEQKTL